MGIDISKKDGRDENPYSYPWNVSTGVSDQETSLISGDV
jgi:hypothetical protein